MQRIAAQGLEGVAGVPETALGTGVMQILNRPAKRLRVGLAAEAVRNSANGRHQV